MVSKPPQSWPPPATTFSPPCLSSSAAAARSRLLPPSHPFLPPMPSFPKRNKKNNKKKRIDKLIDIENSLAMRSNWVVATVDVIWLQRNALMARSLILPIESFHATIFPLVYAAKTVTSSIVDIFHELSKIAPPPSPSPLLFPWRIPDPPPSYLPRFPVRPLEAFQPRGLRTPQESSSSPKISSRARRHLPHRRSHPLLIILDRETLDALILLTVLVASVGSLLISGPFPNWFSTHLLPSLAILNLRSAAVSGVTPFFPLRHHCLIRLLPRHPQPRLTHLNLSRNVLSGFELRWSLLL